MIVLRNCPVCGDEFKTTVKRISENHGKFCSRLCYNNRSDATAVERFWALVNKNGPIPSHQPHLGPCWIWIGTKDKKNGYGRFEPHPAKPVRSHRFIFEVTNGPIPAGIFVCHKCDTPACVRPDHLFAGTAAHNSQDAKSKGRTAAGPRNGRALHPDSYPVGSRHPQSKLTEDRVRQIRQSAKLGIPRRDIAREHGVCYSSVSQIVRRIIWRHVE